MVIFYLNPIGSLIEGMRWSLIGGVFPGNYIFISFFVTLVFFYLGLVYFKKMEQIMADIL